MKPYTGHYFNRELVFSRTRELIKAGATDKEIINIIENDVQAQDREYQDRSRPKHHGGSGEYSFTIIPRSVYKSLRNPAVLDQPTTCPLMELQNDDI